MSVADDAKRLRVREAIRADASKRREAGTTEGAPCALAQTIVEHSYPTASSCFFACLAQNVLGTEVEGGAAIVTSDGAIFHALNLGSAVPPVGTYVLTTFVADRWVFRYDG